MSCPWRCVPLPVPFGSTESPRKRPWIADSSLFSLANWARPSARRPTRCCAPTKAENEKGQLRDIQADGGGKSLKGPVGLAPQRTSRLLQTTRTYSIPTRRALSRLLLRTLSARFSPRRGTVEGQASGPRPRADAPGHRARSLHGRRTLTIPAGKPPRAPHPR